MACQTPRLYLIFNCFHDYPCPVPMTQHQLTLDSDGLALAAILHVPADSVSSASSRPLQKIPGVVVCHPHPRYGGDMNSGVVAGLAQCLQASGIAALRFNHRGVAGSEGEFAGGGDGALADARSALEELSLDELQAVEPRIAASARDVLDPLRAVESRASYGGTAPSQARAQVARARERFL